MKKKIAALFVLTAIALTFTGCNNTKNVPSTNDEGMIETAGTVIENDEGMIETVGTVIENLDGRVLVDANKIKITAHEVTFDKDASAHMYLKIANRTNNDLYFQTRNESVNGCVINGILSEIVEADSEKNVPLWFDENDLVRYGIAAIEKVEFNFYIFTTETHEEYMISDPVSIELKVEGDAIKADTNINVLYESDKIRVVELTDEKYTENAFEYTSVIRIENNTTNEIFVMSDFNGQDDIDLFAQVPSGKIYVTNATLWKEPTETGTELEKKEPKIATISFTINGADKPIHVENAHLTMRCHN